MRLRATPYSLYNLSTIAKRRRGVKRGADGAKRGALMTIGELVSERDVICVCEALVEDVEGGATCLHAIVWDGWRRILWFGAGEKGGGELGLDGAVVVHEEDMCDAARVDPVYGSTLSEYVRAQFAIVGVERAYVVMVKAKEADATALV